MHVRIRLEGDNIDKTIPISKKTTILDLRIKISKQLNISEEQQTLFYKGKQLVDEHLIIDYGIRMNDVVLLMVKNDKENLDNDLIDENLKEIEQLIPIESQFYQINDRIDAIYENGSWFEARILGIFTKSTNPNLVEENLIFKVQLDRAERATIFETKFTDIRPRSWYLFSKNQIKENMTILLNYNIEKPDEIGYWYDFQVKEKTKNKLKGVLMIGKNGTLLENCRINISNKEIYRIEKIVPIEGKISEIPRSIPPRQLPYFCNTCEDNPNRKCNDCGCCICSTKTNLDKLILCDECNCGYHLYCLTFPLKDHPPEPEWYCPECKTDENEIVKPGERLKETTKRKRNEFANKNIEWGCGMSCVGRTNECTIVPKQHFGSIPGIEVGTCWKFRVQVSEAGVHRPPVAGIHGSEEKGAFSIVLSGGYEDDVDNGEEFFYTGAGGRDLYGNRRRINGQSHDQTLTLVNKALALNCNTLFNDKIGGEAENWRDGRPVRVVRSSKLRKHSTYAPIEGFRYDGLYKVVKYFPFRGNAGFIVWRYLLRRDDPSPPPWSQEGKIFDVIYPPGYIEALEVKIELNKTNKHMKSKLKKQYSQIIPIKKRKLEKYDLSREIDDLIKADSINRKLWDECKEVLTEGQFNFLQKVEVLFSCICCFELVRLPIITECNHLICKQCLEKILQEELHKCPFCRNDYNTKTDLEINQNLISILKLLFPSYKV